MYCIETTGLTHQFSENEKILDHIDLRVESHSIYGFLGPNGAGKTTTLKLVLGLLKKQQGTVSFFGLPFDQHRVSILKKVGSLIESPSVYGHLTATENLSILQKIYQCPKSRIGEVLQLVDLAHTGNKKAGQFSLGMKQRLSIAIALLHNPLLLILDEPTNGLDPNGIIEIRELLKKLNRELGTTIIISSHLLSEIEKLVTHVGIINKGEMLFQGTLETLKDKQQQSSMVIFETNNDPKAIQIIGENSLDSKTKDGKIIIPIISKEQISKINQQLVHHNVEVYEMSIVKSDLETIFMDLINN